MKTAAGALEFDAGTLSRVPCPKCSKPERPILAQGRTFPKDSVAKVNGWEFNLSAGAETFVHCVRCRGFYADGREITS